MRLHGLSAGELPRIFWLAGLFLGKSLWLWWTRRERAKTEAAERTWGQAREAAPRPSRAESR